MGMSAHGGRTIQLSIYPVAWLLAVGLFFARELCQGHSLDCSSVIQHLNKTSQIVVTQDILNQIDNDIQSLIDCALNGTLLAINVTSLAPRDTLILGRPIRIKSSVGSLVDCKCPQNGLLNIRSGGVDVSGISITGCKKSPAIRVSKCEGLSPNVRIASTRITRNEDQSQKGVLRVASECKLILDDVRVAENNGSGLVLGKKAQAFLGSSQFLKNSGNGTIVLEDGAELSAHTCTFVSNTAEEVGGALYTQGNNKVQLQNSIFGSNKAAMGGAINAKLNSFVSAANCTFISNVAKITGGAIYIEEESTFNATGCTFFRNLAEDRGGVIRAQDRSHIVTAGCNFTLNGATNYGGAVLAVKDSSMIAKNCTFSRNFAPVEGGALCVVQGFTLEIEGSVFAENTALDEVGFGGGIYAKGADDEGEVSNITIRDTNFTQNLAGPQALVSDGPPAVATGHGWGGAMFLGSSSLVGDGTPYISPKGQLLVSLSQSVRFIENSATRGGAIAAVSVATLSMDSVTFLGNVALEGGAMYVQGDGDPDPRLFVKPGHYVHGRNVAFYKNTASTGGALFLRVSLATAPLRRAGISPTNISQLAPDSRINNEDDFFLENSRFINNTVISRGGAVYSEAGRVGFKDSIFGHNTALSRKSGAGGAVFLSKQSTLNGRNVTLMNNSAAYGAAINARNSLVDLLGAIIKYNHASATGGGLHVWIPSHTIFKHRVVGRMANSTVTGNTARNGGGMNFIMQRPSTPEASVTKVVQKRLRGNRTSIADALVRSTAQVSARELIEQQSRFFAIAESVFENNTAHVTGGAIFTDCPEAVDVCCDCQLEVREQMGEGDDGMRPGVVSVIRMDPSGVSIRPDLCSDTWIGNTAGEEAGAAIVGTTAMYRKVCNTNGECVENGYDTYRIKNHKSGSPLDTFSVHFLDVFKRPTVMEGNTFIQITADGPNAVVTGPVIAPTTAVTNLTAVNVFARVGKVHNLTISFPPSALPNVSVQVKILDCMAGEQITAGGSLCEPCAEGLFSFGTAIEECVICKQHAECRGSTIVPLDGFWHSTSKSTQIHRCIIYKGCHGGGRDRNRMRREAEKAHEENKALTYDDDANYPQCSEGYNGILCGACDETHGKVESGECSPCGDRTKNLMISGALALWFIFLSAILGQNTASVTMESARLSQQTGPERENPSEPSGNQREVPPTQSGGVKMNFAPEVFKIIINFLQVTGLAVVINADWTSSVAKVIGFADVLTSNGTYIFAFQCIFDPNGSMARSIRKILTSLLFPFVIIFIFGIFWGLLTLGKRRPGGYFTTKLSASILAVMYISYIDVTKNVLRLYDCTTVDKKGIDPPEYAIATAAYWVVDPDIQCRRGQHLLLYVALGIPLLAIVIVGMPALLLIFLSHQGANSSKKGYIATYSFLCRAYRPGCKSWEVIVMVRKALMAVIAVYSFALGPNLQSVLALGVLAGALALHLCMRPFVVDGPKLNTLETVSLLASFLSFLAGLIFNDPQTSEASEAATSIVVIGALGVVFIFMLCELAMECIKRIRNAFNHCKSKIDDSAHPVWRGFVLFGYTLRLCMASVPKHAEGCGIARGGGPIKQENGNGGANGCCSKHTVVEQKKEGNHEDDGHVNWELVGRLTERQW